MPRVRRGGTPLTCRHTPHSPPRSSAHADRHVWPMCLGRALRKNTPDKPLIRGFSVGDFRKAGGRRRRTPCRSTTTTSRRSRRSIRRRGARNRGRWLDPVSRAEGTRYGRGLVAVVTLYTGPPLDPAATLAQAPGSRGYPPAPPRRAGEGAGKGPNDPNHPITDGDGPTRGPPARTPTAAPPQAGAHRRGAPPRRDRCPRP